MSITRDEVLDAALGLSESDRLAIAVRLMETLPDDQPGLVEDDDFAAELDRRSGDFEGAVDWSELRDELRRTS